MPRDATSSTVKQLHSVLDSHSGQKAAPQVQVPKRNKTLKRPSLQGVFGGRSLSNTNSQSNDSAISSEGLDEWEQLAYEDAEPSPAATPQPPAHASTSQSRSSDATTRQVTADASQQDALDAAVDTLFQLAGTTPVPDSQHVTASSSPHPLSSLPLLVFSPCRLSNTSLKPADVFARFVQRLEPYVQSDYVSVVFAAPLPASLPTSLLLSTYFNLSRSARKNIKKLYIVHPGFWSKMIIRMFLNGIVSAKVGRKKKIHSVDSLSALARLVDIRQINIPLPVLQHNIKLEPSIALPDHQKGQDVEFGVPLELLMGQHGRLGLPRVVKDCVDHLRSECLHVEGLFRISPSKALLQILRDAYDRGQPVSLSTFQHPQSAPEGSAHLAAALLKFFIGSLPQPVVGSKDYAMIERAPNPDVQDVNSATNAATIAYLRDKLVPHWQHQQGGSVKLLLLATVLELLHEASLRSDRNKMDANSLAVCIAPVLVRSSDLAHDVQLCRLPTAGPPVSSTSQAPRSPTTNKPPTSLAALLVLMIARYYEIFDVDPRAWFEALNSTEVLDTANASTDSPHLASSDPDLSAKSAPASPRASPRVTFPLSLSSSQDFESISPPSSPAAARLGARPGAAHRATDQSVTSGGGQSFAASAMSFGPGISSKRSLKLMKRANTSRRRSGQEDVGTARIPNVAKTKVSVAGLFDQHRQPT